MESLSLSDGGFRRGLKAYPQVSNAYGRLLKSISSPTPSEERLLGDLGRLRKALRKLRKEELSGLWSIAMVHEDKLLQLAIGEAGRQPYRGPVKDGTVNRYGTWKRVSRRIRVKDHREHPGAFVIHLLDPEGVRD